MAAGDRPIWLRYLQHHPADFDAVQYDVTCGGCHAPDELTDHNLRRAWHHNSCKRIDALAWRGPSPTIIEIREHAGIGAIGSLLTYRELWCSDHPTEPVPALMLLTDWIAQDTRRAAEALGINVKVFPPY
jgi:hypothetical protein